MKYRWVGASFYMSGTNLSPGSHFVTSPAFIWPAEWWEHAMWHCASWNSSKRSKPLAGYWLILSENALKSLSWLKKWLKFCFKGKIILMPSLIQTLILAFFGRPCLFYALSTFLNHLSLMHNLCSNCVFFFFHLFQCHSKTPLFWSKVVTSWSPVLMSTCLTILAYHLPGGLLIKTLFLAIHVAALHTLQLFIIGNILARSWVS